MSQSKNEGLEKKTERLWVCGLRDWKYAKREGQSSYHNKILEVEDLRDKVLFILIKLFREVLV